MIKEYFLLFLYPHNSMTYGAIEDLYYYFTKEKNEEKNTFYTKEADMALYNADLNRY